MHWFLKLRKHIHFSNLRHEERPTSDHGIHQTRLTQIKYLTASLWHERQQS